MWDHYKPGKEQLIVLISLGPYFMQRDTRSGYSALKRAPEFNLTMQRDTNTLRPCDGSLSQEGHFLTPLQCLLLITTSHLFWCFCLLAPPLIVPAAASRTVLSALFYDGTGDVWGLEIGGPRRVIPGEGKRDRQGVKGRWGEKDERESLVVRI